MTKKKKVGRPKREEGRTYQIRDIPTPDFLRFQKRCRAAGLTMREALILMIQSSGRAADLSRKALK